MLYIHIPFCERLCPYCSFNRFPFAEDRAVPYFKNLRREMMMVKELGYDFDSLYIGGGTPTIMLDELCETIDLAKSEFSIERGFVRDRPESSDSDVLEKFQGRVNRMSVGVQSIDARSVSSRWTAMTNTAAALRFLSPSRWLLRISKNR